MIRVLLMRLTRYVPGRKLLTSYAILPDIRLARISRREMRLPEGIDGEAPYPETSVGGVY